MFENQNQSGGAEKLYNDAPVSKRVMIYAIIKTKSALDRQTDTRTDGQKS